MTLDEERWTFMNVIYLFVPVVVIVVVIVAGLRRGNGVDGFFDVGGRPFFANARIFVVV